MLWAAVPETAVNEDGKALAPKDEIGAASHGLVPAPPPHKWKCARPSSASPPAGALEEVQRTAWGAVAKEAKSNILTRRAGPLLTYHEAGDQNWSLCRNWFCGYIQPCKTRASVLCPAAVSRPRARTDSCR